MTIAYDILSVQTANVRFYRINMWAYIIVMIM